MGIYIIRSQASNSHYGYRPFWYAEISTSSNFRQKIKLSVKLEGNPATKDYAFMRSKERAQTAFNELKQAKEGDRLAITEIQNLIRVKTGKAINDLPISELGDKFLSYGANVNLSATHKASVKSAFSRFEAFADRQGIKTLLEVTKAIAVDFIAFEAKTLANATINKHITALKKAFGLFLPSGASNPFNGAKSLAIGKRKNDTIHHKPLSEAEILRLLEVAKDSIWYGAITTAVATGLRIEDICLLKWDNVDLINGIIKTKTIKTGAVVALPIVDDHPILGGLRNVLETVKKSSIYVFPSLAKLYQTDKRKVYNGCKRLMAQALGDTTTSRHNGRKTSVLGWHSLRSTFVTLMSDYLPLDVIKSLVGHTTTTTTLEYLHPSYEQAVKKAKKALIKAS